MKNWDLMNFLQTLKSINFIVLDKKDDELTEFLFFETTPNIVTFLSNNVLTRLIDNGIITDKIFKKSENLQKKYLQLYDQKHWIGRDIKNNVEWQGIFDLSDEIMHLIKERWTDEELKYLQNMK